MFVPMSALGPVEESFRSGKVSHLPEALGLRFGGAPGPFVLSKVSAWVLVWPIITTCAEPTLTQRDNIRPFFNARDFFGTFAFGHLDPTVAMETNGADNSQG